jgi:ATP-binding cassette subfamily B protein AbcA/BmrA
MTKAKKFLKDIIFVSRITRVGNKKIRILMSALFSNITVFLDISIIIIFSNYFIDTNYENIFIKLIIENSQFLPLFIILRFLIVLLDKINIRSLQLSISQNLKEYLIEDIFKKSNYSISDATYYLTQLTEHVSYFYGALAVVFGASLQLIVYIFFLLTVDSNTLLSFFAIGLILSIPTLFFLKKGRLYMDSAFKFGKEISSKTQRIIDNLFLIKILNTEENEMKNFNLSNKDFTKSQLKNFTFNTLNAITPNFVVTFSLSLLIVSFGYIKNLTLEFIGIALRLVQTIGTINNGLNMIVNSHVHLKVLQKIDSNKVSSFSSSSLDLNKLEKNDLLLVENVSFKYFGSTDLFFQNINFRIKKHSHTLITGSNGSGKSTLLGLIAGVLRPESGQIKHNFNRVSYVGVNPLIVTGSLRENLLYGNRSDIKDEDILHLLNKFKLFNESNSLNLDSEISNKTLSSGQFQKIAYIRAFLYDPELLILDESTSNLDEYSKKIIIEYMQNQNYTIVNSTHNDSDFISTQKIQVVVEENIRKLNFYNLS